MTKATAAHSKEHMPNKPVFTRTYIACAAAQGLRWVHLPFGWDLMQDSWHCGWFVGCEIPELWLACLETLLAVVGKHCMEADPDLMGQGTIVSCHGYPDPTQTVEQQTMLSGLLATAEQSDPPIGLSLFFILLFLSLPSGSAQQSTDSCICYPQRSCTVRAASTGIDADADMDMPPSAMLGKLQRVAAPDEHLCQSQGFGRMSIAMQKRAVSSDDCTMPTRPLSEAS
ncbi:hypothetical protein BBK36DRAFT_143401 [Trichoderma citrinoviride]|uniref:Uncharacterized protein n=1 Tax=Trichoderma citrinoviride TaxID=58853 RepID=A0A2T4B5A1_9HYPO|nr:hypothetical protein BBK36DRAFT_143401 [Trichoderma citrinoviride]PTB64480.1 hypothetical protein BBK36DRAFT_143401 [Trichoderma citrinoviride]